MIPTTISLKTEDMVLIVCCQLVATASLVDNSKSTMNENAVFPMVNIRNVVEEY